MNALRALLCTEGLSPEYGGPVYTVQQLCVHLRLVGVDAVLDANKRGGQMPGAVYDLGATSRRGLGGASLVHSFGIWRPFVHRAVSSAQRSNVPVVISPIGMLMPWAMRQKRAKKRLAWLGYQRRDIEMATAIHVTSSAEAEAVRDLGIAGPMAVIPHGIHLPDTSECLSRGEERNAASRVALFLSRMNRNKGLHHLIDAWSVVRPRGWKLIVAGPDEGGYRAEMEQRAIRMGVSEAIQFVGPRFQREKEALFRAAELFILPTYTENFGVVVAEALSYGVPVITTRGAPWSEIVKAQCGWWIDVGVEALKAALDQATKLSRRELQSMGHRGVELMRDNYSWRSVAQRHRQLYEWCVKGGRTPEFFV